MRVTEPIEVEILRILSDGDNHNPVRVWWLLHTEYLGQNPDDPDGKNWGTDYVGQRMGRLVQLELLERLEPTDRSGLYRMTDFGHAALEHIEETGETEFSFSDLLERVEREPEENESSSE